MAGLAAGRQGRLHPLVSLEVLEVVPERWLLLAEDWAFVLRPGDGGSTRMIVRSRGALYPDLRLSALNFVFWRLVFELAHALMERGMLRGIKRRAEGTARLAQGRAASAVP